MATAHDATGFSQFQGGVKYSEGQGRSGVLHFHVNMADVVEELGVKVDPNNGDTLDIWDIPIGTQITGVLLHVVTAATTTAAGGTATIAIGDAATGAGYLAATTIKTTGYTGTVVTDTYAAATKVYSVASLFRLTFAGNATAVLTGIFDVYAYCTMTDIAAAEPGSWA